MQTAGSSKDEKAVEKEFAVTLDLDHGYQFDAKFDSPGIPHLRIDETPPIGDGAGPSPARLLATAVGHCLASSALYCLRKARIDVLDMTVVVRGEMVRNDAGRLRVGRLAVQLAPRVAERDVERMKRCLQIFEDFCVVTGAVRDGVTVDVDVSPVPS